MTYPANFKGRAAHLGPNDVLNAAMIVGTDPAHLAAVIEVETAGSGFDSVGRPKMLFEPHCFYALLPTGSLRELAVTKGVACEHWGGRYPPDSYPMLTEAVLIDAHAALMSASWGLGQIMGSHYAAVGQPSVEAMVAAACDSESAQLKQLVYFLRGRLATLLWNRNWTGFARAYNGPGQVDVYAARLEAAYTRQVLQGRTPVIPLPPGPPPPTIEAASSDDLNGRELRRIETGKTTTVV